MPGFSDVFVINTPTLFLKSLKTMWGGYNKYGIGLAMSAFETARYDVAAQRRDAGQSLKKG
jgi:hypothetical protein